MSLLIFQSDGKTFLIKFNTQRRPTLAIDCSAEFCFIAVFIQSCNVNLGGCDSVKRDGDFRHLIPIGGEPRSIIFPLSTLEPNGCSSAMFGLESA